LSTVLLYQVCNILINLIFKKLFKFKKIFHNFSDPDPPALPPKRGKIMTSPYRELTPPNSPNKVYITEVISTPIQTQCLEIQ